jgi:PAS domain S-box-containing protein
MARKQIGGKKPAAARAKPARAAPATAKRDSKGHNKRAETAAMRLAAVVQSSHDAIAAKTLNGIITDWNQSAQRIFGYKPKEIIGKSVLTLIPKDRQGEEEEILKRIRRGESLDHYETVRRRKDGKLIDVSLTISPIKGPKGEIVGVSKIARDITRQKQTERRLAEQARLLDLTSDAIIVRDHRDRIVYWNRGAEEMYGFSAKEAFGKITHELLQTVLPENLEKIRKNLERNNHWSGELIHVRKDGAKAVVISRWSRDRDAKGRSAVILETNTEISDRKRSEERTAINLAVTRILSESPALRDAVTKILQTVCGTLEWEIGAFWVPELDGSVLRCFKVFESAVDKFRKFKAASLKLKLALGIGLPGRVWKSLKTAWVPDITKDGNFPRVAIAAREGLHGSFAFPVSFGKHFLGVMEFFSSEIRGPDEDVVKMFASIGSQIGQFVRRKQAEEALERSKEMLETMVERRTQALHAANTELREEIARRRGLEGEILKVTDREQQRLGQELHDGLCQQLAAIGLMVQTAALRLRNHRVIDAEELEKIAQLVNNSAVDARHIARDLHKEQVEAAGFEQAVRDLTERKIWNTPCRLRLKTKIDLDDDFVASELYRILREVITNANKHARATQITVEVWRHKRHLAFIVEDNGVGLNGKVSRNEGLGFHIMKYRAKMIGARFEVDAPRKGGTRVTVHLPATPRSAGLKSD